MKIESLDHIHIYAANPEFSAQFYQTHFDAKPVSRDTNINGDTRIFLALGGQIIVVGSFPAELSPRRFHQPAMAPTPMVSESPTSVCG